MSSNRNILYCLLIITTSFLVFSRVINNSLLLNWDDYDYIVNNGMIHGLFWNNILSAFSEPYFHNYAPLHLISYMLDYSLFGGIKEAPMFAENVLLHALNGILLFIIVFKISNNRVISIFSSLLFIVHPVQVESVAWLSQRKNLLSMFFLLLSMISYIRYADKEKGYLVYYILSIILALCALLTKSVTVIIPIIFLLYDICTYRKITIKLILDKIPYLLMVIVIGLLTVKAQNVAVDEGRAIYKFGGHLQTIYTMIPVYIKYIIMIIYPHELSILYMPQVKTNIDIYVVLSFATLLVIFIACAYIFIRDRKLFFWIGIYFVSLLPVSQIVALPTLMNDRYLYFPMIGASVFISSSGFEIYNKCKDIYRKYLMAFFCLILIIFAVSSWQRTFVWRNDIALWEDTTKKVPNSSLAWLSLGMSYYDNKKYSDAIRAYEKCLSIDTYYKLALNNIGGLYNQTGEFNKARMYLLSLIQLYPEYFEGYMNLGNNYFNTKEYEKAADCYKKALQINSNSDDAKVFLENTYQIMQKVEHTPKAKTPHGY